MWTIVEGCTAVGKSTLYETLKESVKGGADLVHMGQPAELTRRWALNEYVNKWTGDRADHTLADRWHWGELTYSPIYRPDTNTDGYGLLGKAGWRWTELFLASRGACVALLTADNKTLAARLEDRGDDHVQNLDELFRVSSLYDSARRESINVAASFDTSDPVDEGAYKTFLDTFLEEAQRRSDASRLLISRFPGYIGPLAPGLLLVGDKRNINEDRHGEETILPFMPVDGNSGEFLLNALPDMTWRTCGIINGAEIDNVPVLLTALGDPKVVALGNSAKAALLAQGVDEDSFAWMPHPQWARRFHNAKQKAYGQAIVEAADTGRDSSTWML